MKDVNGKMKDVYSCGQDTPKNTSPPPVMRVYKSIPVKMKDENGKMKDVCSCGQDTPKNTSLHQ